MNGKNNIFRWCLGSFPLSLIFPIENHSYIWNRTQPPPRMMMDGPSDRTAGSGGRDLRILSRSSLYWLAEPTYSVRCIRPQRGSAMKMGSDIKHTVVVVVVFFNTLFLIYKKKNFCKREDSCRNNDYLLCSCLFSSSNKNKILRVTLKKKGLFGYQDVQTHNVQIRQLMQWITEKVSWRNSCLKINCFLFRWNPKMFLVFFVFFCICNNFQWLWRLHQKITTSLGEMTCVYLCLFINWKKRLSLILTINFFFLVHTDAALSNISAICLPQCLQTLCWMSIQKQMCL